jgi:hypothetical protein
VRKRKTKKKKKRVNHLKVLQEIDRLGLSKPRLLKQPQSY